MSVSVTISCMLIITAISVLFVMSTLEHLMNKIYDRFKIHENRLDNLENKLKKEENDV